MKTIAALLFALLLVLQYELVFDVHSGLIAQHKMKQQIQQQQVLSQRWSSRNGELIDSIRYLRSGDQAIEARARYDLGMIKPNEVYYQFVR